MPRIFISPRCINLISEFLEYKVDIKERDHAVDFEVPESDAMTVEEIDAKIKSLQKEKDKLDAELCAIYSERNDKEKELQAKIQELYTQYPNTDLKTKTTALYGQLDELSAQISLFRKAKIEKTVGAALEGEGSEGQAVSTDTVSQSPAIPVKPEIVLTPAAESTKILVERLKKLSIVCF